jgi:hypothetical protein
LICEQAVAAGPVNRTMNNRMLESIAKAVATQARSVRAKSRGTGPKVEVLGD